METFGEKLGRWIIKYRWWVMIGTLVTVGVIAKGALLLPIQNDVRIYFGENNKQLKALEQLENVYTKNDSVLFVISPKDGRVFNQRTLRAVKELTDISWQIPYSNRVDSVTNFQHTSVIGDNLVVGDLFPDPERMSREEIKRLQKIALSEPRLVNLLISETGHVTAVRANIIRPNESMNEAPEIAALARKVVADFKDKYPDIDIYLTGEIIGDVTLSEATVKDMETLIPLMNLTMFIIMVFMLKSLLRAIAVFLIIGFSVITSVGVGGFIGLHLNPTTGTAPLIIITLAIADSVHFVLMMCQFARDGLPKKEAIVKSLHVNLKPIFLTSATTAVSFLSMNFAEAVPFREFGNMVAIGVMAAFVYSILFLPALISILPLRIRPVTKSKYTIYDRFANLIINKRDHFLWGTLALVILAGLGISQIEVTDNFNKWYDERYDFRVGTDFVEENLTGLDIIEYSLGAGETGGIHDTEYLEIIEKYAEWYRRQPNVVHVSTINETIKRINQDMHGGDETYYCIPDTKEMVAQYLLLYEMSLPFGHDLNNRIDIDKSATRVSVYVKNSSSQFLLDMDQQAKLWLQKNAPQSMVADGTGLSMMYAHLIRNNTQRMFKGSFIALLIVVGILIFAFRLFKLSFAVIIPNIGPIIMGFGIWGLIFGQAGIAISILISMTLGIVVDDTVHFLSKYLQYRREHGKTSREAVRYSFNTVGSALVVTTMILVVGFSILSFSGFAINKDMSVITVIIIVLAFILDFSLLPALLMKAEEKTVKKFDMDHPYAPAPAPYGGYNRP